jgi:hypothetical protein
MPFGLIKDDTTFQREMDITFCGLINQSVVVYLDDVTIFSKNKKDHLSHLRDILERCRKFDISLNPTKSVFALEQGKLLGFIVSKDRMIIDPERNQEKKKIDHHQQIVKGWFDSNSSLDRNFDVGYLVLKWDKSHEGKGEHTKFQNLWLGPFVISEKLGPNSFRLHNLEG